MFNRGVNGVAEIRLVNDTFRRCVEHQTDMAARDAMLNLVGNCDRPRLVETPILSAWKNDQVGSSIGECVEKPDPRVEALLEQMASGVPRRHRDCRRA